MDIEEPPSETLLELQNTLKNVCSYTIQFDEKPNTITKEQSLVVKDIEKAVKEDERMVKKIMNGMNEIFQNETYLKKALFPTVLKKEGVTFAIEQESLVRLLLRVNQLQEEIFKLIIEEMSKVCSDTEDCSMMRLLLNPLKYLPNINNAENFSESLLDLLEIGSSELQLEMLDFIPDIIPDSHYDKVAEQLLRILSSGQGPGDAIIGCFGSFDFDDNVRENLYGTLFDQILPVNPDCLSATLKLLFNNQKGKISPEVFLKIRDMIDSIMTETASTERKISIINILRSISNKGFIIQSSLDVMNRFKTAKEHKPFDLLVMLIFGDDTKYKELIRKKVELDHFTSELVASLMPFALLDENFDGIIKLTSYLLRFHSEKVQNFTKSLLDAVFSCDLQGVQRVMLTREIVDCLIRACNNSDLKCVHQTLRIFYNLVVKLPDKFYENLNKMMGLLRKMDDFDLYAASMVYQIICHIPSSVGSANPQAEAIKNEISLVIRKQLMSSKRLKKSKGVMGSIMQLKNDIRKTTGDSVECGYNSDDEPEMFDSPPATISEASIIVEGVCVLTEGIPECTGLFYDELASLLCKLDVKMDFIKWITKRTRSLLENYIIDSNGESKEINDLVLEADYSIDKTKSYVVNIGAMAMEPQKHDNSPLVLLPALFRLYRTYYNGKTLDSLQAGDYEYFLNCSFMLPDIDNLEDLDSYQLKQVIDLLYHTINYLKEVVEASIDEEIPRKTFIDRLQLLIKLENIFNNLLKRIPEHTFPLPYFNDCSKSKQLHEIKKKTTTTTKGNKRRKVVLEDSAASTSMLSSRPLDDTSIIPVSTSRKKKGPIAGSKYLVEHNINFREISLINLFNMIVLGTDSNERIQLNRSHMIFVLRYTVRQLRALFRKKPEVSVLEVDLTPEKVLEKISLRLPAVTKIFTEIVEEMDSLDVCDIEDDTHCDLIMCYSYLLEIFLLLLSAPVKQPSELMNKIHLCLDVDKDEKDTRKKLVATFSGHLEDSRLLSHSVLIYQIIDKIVEYQPMRRSKELKVKLCEKIVNKKWSSSKFLLYSEKQMNQDTKLVLEKYLQEKRVKELHELLTKVVDEYSGLSDRNYHLPCLLIVNHSNFHILFVSLCTALQQNVEKEVQERGISNMEHLRLWKDTTNIMFILMNIARNELTKHNTLLCAFLKTSIPILKIFIAQALPFFQIIFRSNLEAVVEILKTMQSSTRFLHHLCCQSKMFKNLSVVSHIPSFRLVLEQLIYKVKALLFSHNCNDAFFLGNLKNKDIHGNTQTSEQMEEDITQENDGEDEEILPSEDESDGNVDDDDRSESLTF